MRAESVASFVSASDGNLRSFYVNKENKISKKIWPTTFTKFVHEFKNNSIVTSKYSILSFIPLNLMVQFSKMANLYFLLLSVMEQVPAISSSNGSPVMLMSLGFVVGISMIKDIYEDFQRHQSDKEENNRVTLACPARTAEQI